MLQDVFGSISRTAEGYTRCLFRTGCVTEISVTEAFHNLSRYLFPLHHQIVGQKSASLPILTYCLHKSIDLKLDPFKNSTASPPPPFGNKSESIINMVRGDPNDTMTSNDSSSSTKSGTWLVLLCQHLIVRHQMPSESLTLDHRCQGAPRQLNGYLILTKHAVLDRNFSISQRNPLPAHISAGIPDPPPTRVMTLHQCAAPKNTTETILIHCNRRDQNT